MDTKCETLQNPIHGNIYQLKLLMLFLYRGVTNGYNFCLRTETKEAGKFDDIVFQYEENGKTHFRLLQAKHKLDTRNKITAGSLLNCTSRKDDYSLKKYFYSFRESKKERIFKKGSFKDLIICTNIDFDYEDLRENKIDIVEIGVDDNILDVMDQTVHEGLSNSNLMKPKRFKFQKSFAETLKQKLEEDYSDSNVINTLIDYIFSGKPLRKQSFLGYAYVLLNEIIDNNDTVKTFKRNFIENDQLSERAAKFRELLDQTIEKRSYKKFNLGTLNEAIKNKEKFNEKRLSIIIPKQFCEDDRGSWPLNHVLLSDVEEFLDLLVFAVNQPDEEKLGEAIKNEIGNQFNNITTEQIYKDLFHHMLDLLQGKKLSKTVSNDRFRSHSEGKSFINNTRKTILYLQLSGFRDHLESIPISFNQLEEPQNFISSGECLWLMSSNTPWLSSLFIYKSLKKILFEGNNRNNFIYIFNWSDLLVGGERLLLDFKGLDNFVIIITCLQMIGSKEITSNFAQIICDILSESSVDLKRLIVVSLKQHELIEELKLKVQSFHKGKLKIKFNDIGNKYKAELLKKKNIIFQRHLKLSIEELLDIEQSNMLTLDAATIEVLLRNSEVNVLEDFLQIHDFNCITHNAYKPVNFNQIRDTIVSSTNDVFTFFGDENKINSFLLDLRKEPLKFNTSDTLDKVFSHRFILLDPDKESQEFNRLCQMICEDSCVMKPILHKLKFVENGECFWMKTFDYSFYIDRYWTPININTNIFERLSTSSSDFVVFSGMSRCKLLKLIDNKTDDTEKCNIVFSHNNAARKFNSYLEILEGSQSYVPNDSFSKVKRLLNKTAVHWVKVSTDTKLLLRPSLKLVWVQSSGNVDILSKGKESEDFLHERHLAHLDQKTILISNKSGMGKSSFMIRMAQYLKRKEPRAITIKIDLNQQQNILTSSSIRTKQQLVALFFRILKRSSPNPLAQMIMEYKLNYRNQVIFLFDGFDEIIRSKQESILRLLKYINRNTNALMFITTRPESEQLLQRSFCVMSYSIMDFHRRDIIQFLMQFWKTSLTFSGNDYQNINFKNIVEDILLHYDSLTFKKFSSFVKCPLMLRMFAEKLVTDSSLNNIETEENLVIDMYKSFVQNTYKTYFFEKIRIVEWFDNDGLTILKDAYSEAYGRLAVKLMTYNSDGQSIVTFLGEEKISLNALERIGLIQTLGEPGKPTFVHPSFADYFAPEYICNKLKACPSEKILWKILINSILDYELSSIIFDEKLKMNSKFVDLPSENPQKSIVLNLLKEQIDEFGKPKVLISATKRNLKQTVLFLCKCIQNTNDLETVTNLPLRLLRKFYTRETNAYCVIDLFLEYDNILRGMTLLDSIGRRLLRLAQENGTRYSFLNPT